MKTLAKLQMVQEMLDRVRNEQAHIGVSKTSFGESKILDLQILTEEKNMLESENRQYASDLENIKKS